MNTLKNQNEKLIEEMRRWLAGEEDEHDKVIREHKEFMKEQITKAKTYAEEQRQIAIEKKEEIQAIPLVGYSLDDIKQKTGGITQSTTIGVHLSKDNEKVLNKIMADALVPEPLNPEQDSIFNQSKTSLMDKITQRQPKI